MEPQTDENLGKTWPLKAVLALLAAGLWMAIYLVWIKLQLKLDSSFKSICDLSEVFNCGQVQTDPASELFGLPISLLAVPTYLVMATLAIAGIRGGSHARPATAYLAGIAALTVVHSLYLAYVSSFVIGAYCLFCIGLYVVNLGSLVLAVSALDEGLAGAAKRAAASLGSGLGPLARAAAVLVLSGGVAIAWFGQIEASMAEATKAAGAAEMFPELVDGGKTGSADTKAADTAQPKASTRPVARPKPKLTDNGWSYYEVPVEAHNPTIGPADAPVTITVIKDFECSYCKYVTYQTKELKKTYKDEVQWVFKHYPMNGDCNYRMGTSRMHEGACRAAFASVCAQEQGKFWEMHDVLYQNQKKFSDEELQGYAEKVGMDVAAYDACYASERPAAAIKKDIQLASKMRINGTPRIYINNRAVTGSIAKDVLDYYIQLASKASAPMDAAVAQVAGEATPRMIEMKKQSGPFWIDAFESSMDKTGKAVSVPNVMPAFASWFDADRACKAAGKRMCTEEEWVSACIGEAANDHNKNGKFVDGPVVGRLYPYGPFYVKGTCRDTEDKLVGKPTRTGSLAGCRTPEGVYDLSGNVYEWIGTTAEEAAMMGGDFRTKTSGTCRRRAATYGAGYKNETIGFRCCAEAEIKDVATASDVKATEVSEIVGAGIPDDLTLNLRGGGTLDPKLFKGKVTYLTFFASWCGNCRKQMPAIKAWEDDWKKKGFQVVGINVDRKIERGEKYIKELEPNFKIAYDPSARTMTDFDINAMPTSFIVDRKGKVVRRIVGYKDAEIAATKKAITDLL
jgi:protein-disulfide isomerase/uncharacterized membrane protein/thiol-disulfide isomerase/thioredoxin